MDILEDQIIEYIDAKTAALARVCSKAMLFNTKFLVNKIEIWYTELLVWCWIREINKIIYKKVPDNYCLSYSKGCTKCKLCGEHYISDVVYVNNKLIFSCYICFCQIEDDVLNESSYYQHDTLHTYYDDYKLTKNVTFHIIQDEIDVSYENCRAQ